MSTAPSYLPARKRLVTGAAAVPMGESRRVGILRRWSTPRQGDNARIGLQFSDMDGIVTAQGWEPAPYDDGQVSGRKSVAARRAAAQMLHDLETGAIQGIAAIELSRIAREPSGLDLAKFVHALLEQDAPLVLADEILWPSNPQHRMKIELLRMYASWEWDTIRSRMWKPNVMRRLGTERVTSAGLPPIGYRWKLIRVRKNGTPERELEQDPEFAPTVREAFRHAATAPSLRATMGHLNETGLWFRTRNWERRPWIGSDLDNVLRNPIYSGRLVPFRYSQENRYIEKLIVEVAGERLDPKTGYVVVPCPHLAYVAPEEQDAIVAMLERRKAVPKASRRDGGSPLSGLLRCGLCGGRMRSSFVRKRKHDPGSMERFYDCCGKHEKSSTCPGQWYEDAAARRAVYTFIQDALGHEIRERIPQEGAAQESEAVSRDVENLRRMVRQLEDDQAAVMGYLMQFKDQPSLVVKWSETLRQKERELEETRRELEERLRVSQAPDLISAATKLQAVFPDYLLAQDAGTQRAVLLSLFEEVRVAAIGYGKKRRVEVIYAKLINRREPVVRVPSWESSGDEQTSGSLGIIAVLSAYLDRRFAA